MFVIPFKDTSQVLLGMMTKTNKIGVVGSHPIPEIIRNINGMTLGVSNRSIQMLRFQSYGSTHGLIHQRIWMMDKVLDQQGNDVLFTTTDSPSVVMTQWNR